jgi:DNA phosphorothioation-dependent restriction protein DptH
MAGGAPTTGSHAAPAEVEATPPASAIERPAALPPATAPAPPHLRLPAPDGLRVELGTLNTGQPAIWLPNRTDLVNHFNVGITGTMGTGKTQLTKSLLAQIVWAGADNVGGRPPGVLIFDYKGDYGDTPREPFATAIGARVLAPEQLPLNPLHASQPSTRQELALLPQIFADTLRAIDPRVGTVQRNQIIRAVKECYQTAGIDERRPETWTLPFPTVRALYAHIEAHDLVDGVPRSILQDLADLGVFADEDPPVELDQVFDGINVVNLSPSAGRRQ